MSSRLTHATRQALLAVLSFAALATACGDEGLPERVLGPTGGQDSCPAPHIIFLNGGGGTYRYGEVSDSFANTSNAWWFEPKDAPVTLPPCKFTTADWEGTVACLQDAFAPFNVLVTDLDPGDQDHIEIVFSTSDVVLAINCNREDLYTFCTSSDCVKNHRGIGFLRGEGNFGVANNCAWARETIGFIAGLDHSAEPCDGMAVHFECDDEREFLDMDVPCGDLSGETTVTFDCRCTGEPTQNSYQSLLEFFGPRCEP